MRSWPAATAFVLVVGIGCPELGSAQEGTPLPPESGAYPYVTVPFGDAYVNIPLSIDPFGYGASPGAPRAPASPGAPSAPSELTDPSNAPGRGTPVGEGRGGFRAVPPHGFEPGPGFRHGYVVVPKP